MKEIFQLNPQSVLASSQNAPHPSWMMDQVRSNWKNFQMTNNIFSNSQDTHLLMLLIIFCYLQATVEFQKNSQLSLDFWKQLHLLSVLLPKIKAEQLIMRTVFPISYRSNVITRTGLLISYKLIVYFKQAYITCIGALLAPLFIPKS